MSNPIRNSRAVQPPVYDGMLRRNIVAGPRRLSRDVAQPALFLPAPCGNAGKIMPCRPALGVRLKIAPGVSMPRCGAGASSRGSATSWAGCVPAEQPVLEGMDALFAPPEDALLIAVLQALLDLRIEIQVLRKDLADHARA